MIPDDDDEPPPGFSFKLVLFEKVAVFSCCETAKERWRELELGRAIFKD